MKDVKRPFRGQKFCVIATHQKKGEMGRGRNVRRRWKRKKYFYFQMPIDPRKKGLGGVSQGSVNYYYPLDT